MYFWKVRFMDDIMFVHSGWGNINSIKNSMDLTPWRTLKLTMLSETCMNSTPTAKKLRSTRIGLGLPAEQRTKSLLSDHDSVGCVDLEQPTDNLPLLYGRLLLVPADCWCVSYFCLDCRHTACRPAAQTPGKSLSRSTNIRASVYSDLCWTNLENDYANECCFDVGESFLMYNIS